MVSTALASEGATHWYLPDGTPFYTVTAKNGNERPAHIGDARKVGAVPSVTKILSVAASPGLEQWKLNQTVLSALTLPRINGESDTDFAKRVIEDSKEQARAAAARGTELHTAIEDYIKGQRSLIWEEHIAEIGKALNAIGIDMTKGEAEHSFALDTVHGGFGGKVDFFSRVSQVIIDYKSKDVIDDSKQLAWDNHVIQLSAYSKGLQLPSPRALNVFCGVNDKKVRIREWTAEDMDEAWNKFKCLLQYWHLCNKL